MLIVWVRWNNSLMVRLVIVCEQPILGFLVREAVQRGHRPIRGRLVD
jgi:hypothetical protein